MGLLDFLNKSEALIALDIGNSSIKLVELDLGEEKPTLVNIGISALNEEVFSNNAISKTEQVSEKISALLEANAISDRRIVTAMPGPSVFTKKIKMPKQDPAELRANIQFEASNFIPHSTEAVRLDYHIIGESGKNQLDILVVAVKNEIIDSFMEALALAGLEAAVVDVDYFALQNMFEISYPELVDETVALINMGARYSSINICKETSSLFTGDMAVGGKLFVDAVSEGLGITSQEAEQLIRSKDKKSAQYEAARELIDQNVEYVASEFNRQLSFFWNASGDEEGIDRIMICGGGALIPGLLEEISEKTGIETQIIDPFRGVECGEGVDPGYVKELGALMGVAVGLGLRQPGDKIMLEY
ncbi:MAG: type IV pilus assembly protein PilM [Candidatus Dadabacteria bacterium]|nr:MAG: type IV pilus assembly protein PilM [Candidatus Dadabacteria bacterium]